MSEYQSIIYLGDGVLRHDDDVHDDNVLRQSTLSVGASTSLPPPFIDPQLKDPRKSRIPVVIICNRSSYKRHIMPPFELKFITGNKNKLAEVQAMLGNIVNLQNQSLDLVEIQGTMEAISSDKCRRAAEQVSKHHRRHA